MSDRLRHVPLDLLHTLLLFAEHKETLAVAGALHRTEAVVSRRLKDLREKYGLLRKHGQTQLLTRKGQEALPVIRALLLRSARLEAWLTEKEDRPQVIRVATGSRVAQVLVPRAAALFAADHPHCQIQVEVRRGRERILGTADGTFDLAVVSHDGPQVQKLAGAHGGEGARLRVTDLARECLCLIARKGSAAGEQLAGAIEGQSVPVAWLAQLELAGLDGQSGIRGQLEDCAGGRPLRFRVAGGGWAAARECARRGVGAAVVPVSLLVPADRDDLVIRRLAGRARLTDRLIDRPGDEDADHEAFRQALIRAARDHEDEVRAQWGGFLAL